MRAKEMRGGNSQGLYSISRDTLLRGSAAEAKYTSMDDNSSQNRKSGERRPSVARLRGVFRNYHTEMNSANGV